VGWVDRLADDSLFLSCHTSVRHLLFLPHERNTTTANEADVPPRCWWADQGKKKLGDEWCSAFEWRYTGIKRFTEIMKRLVIKGIDELKKTVMKNDRCRVDLLERWMLVKLFTLMMNLCFRAAFSGDYLKMNDQYLRNISSWKKLPKIN